MSWIHFISLFLFSFVGVMSQLCLAQSKKPMVENLILFIGDGMGPAVVNATRMQFLGKSGVLTMDQFPHTAIVKTSSLDEWVTDSAAGGSAMATGIKTLNGALSVSVDSKTQKISFNKTLFEMAALAGKRVGLVTTSEIYDATPAAFYAHTKSRKNTSEIVRDLSQSSVDLIMGGGWEKLKKEKYRKKLKKNFSLQRKLFSPQKCRKKRMLGIFSDKALPPAIQTQSKGPYNLMDLTELALDCLTQKKQKGFVLLVENEDIDESLHRREIPQALYATRELDWAVKRSIQWLKKKKLLDKTLIVITADHDTGGLSINGPVPAQGIWVHNKTTGKFNIPKVKGEKYPGPAYRVVKLSTDFEKGPFSKAPHSALDVHLFAKGPGAEQFHGTIENTEIFNRLKRLLGF